MLGDLDRPCLPRKVLCLDSQSTFEKTLLIDPEKPVGIGAAKTDRHACRISALSIS